mgnify:CR=1 FL=1
MVRKERVVEATETDFCFRAATDYLLIGRRKTMFLFCMSYPAPSDPLLSLDQLDHRLHKRPCSFANSSIRFRRSLSRARDSEHGSNPRLSVPARSQDPSRYASSQSSL